MEQSNIPLPPPTLCLPDTGFLREDQVLQFIPISPSLWWAGVKTGEYPKPRKLSKRTTGWKAEDIRALIAKINNQAL